MRHYIHVSAASADRCARLLVAAGVAAAAMAQGSTAAHAQSGCGVAMPDFQAALKANTQEALANYLDKHAPCFEAPARARLQALGGAAQPESAAEAAPAAGLAAQPDAGSMATSCEKYVDARSLNSDVPMDVEFVNRTDMSLAVEWIGYDGARRNYGLIEPGQSFYQQTFLTHPWEFAGPQGQCIAIIQPDQETRTYEIRN